MTQPPVYPPPGEGPPPGQEPSPPTGYIPAPPPPPVLDGPPAPLTGPGAGGPPLPPPFPAPVGPPPPPKKSKKGLVIGLVIGAVVLLCMCGGGGMTAWYFLGDDGDDEPASQSFPQSYEPTVAAAPAEGSFVFDFSESDTLCPLVDTSRVDKVLTVEGEPSGSSMPGEGATEGSGYISCSVNLDSSAENFNDYSLGSFDVEVDIMPYVESAYAEYDSQVDSWVTGEPLTVEGVTDEAAAAVDRENGTNVWVVTRNGNLVMTTSFFVTAGSSDGVRDEVLLNVSIDMINDIVAQLA
ncbi:MAG: hypothetical protein ACRDXX_16765 [Stackebrandtia sp.]